MTHWRALTGSALGVAIAALIVARPAPTAARAQAVERHLYVSVLDNAGTPVTDLRADEFAVREDDQRREVLRASRAAAPMQIAILIDTSEAAEPYIRDIRDGITAFVDAIDADHEIALITFGERPKILVESTRDRTQLRAGIGRIFALTDTGSYLLDALGDTAQGFERRAAYRPVIVVLTTEGIEFSTRYHLDVLETMQRAGASLHALVLRAGDDGGWPRDETRNRDIVLGRGPELTGGRQQLLLSSLAFPARLQALAAELANQYLVTYARPPRLIPPKNIHVGVSRPQATARGTPAKTPPGA